MDSARGGFSNQRIKDSEELWARILKYMFCWRPKFDFLPEFSKLKYVRPVSCKDRFELGRPLGTYAG